VTPSDRLQAARRAFALGDRSGAEQLLGGVLQADPDNFEALQLQGVLLATSDRLADAVTVLEKAVKVRPNQPAAWMNLGEAYRRLGCIEEAVRVLQRAVELGPHLEEVWFNLGTALKAAGNVEASEEAFRQALSIAPRHARAWFNLGNLLREDGRVAAAVDAYQQALATAANWPEAWQNLAAASLELGDAAAAVNGWRKVRELAPWHPKVDAGEATALLQAGHVASARKLFQRLAEFHPESLGAQLRAILPVEPIAISNAAIDEYRARLAGELDRLVAARFTLNVSDLAHSGCEPPMQFNYQGRSDRGLKEAFARLFTQALPDCEPPPSGSGVPHVGVVVSRGHEQGFDRCLGRLLDEVVCPELRISLVGQRGAITVLRQLRPERRCSYFPIPEDVGEAAEQIRAAGFDLLHYWQHGTDSTNYFLPFLKPSRVQSATWGWPGTTGLAVMDAYVSCAWLEAQDADAHYVEPLVRLQSLPTRIERPPQAGDNSLPDAAEWTRQPGTRLYLCPHNLRKLHPDLDPAVASLLDADPAAIFAVIADAQPSISEALIDRLRAHVNQPQRIRLIPRQSRADYLRLLTAASVLLDPPHYGGGANTVADVLACAVPLVAWEGPFHRGRWVSGVYRALGVEGLTATTPEEWVTLATRIATDPDLLAYHRRQMRTAAEQLFAPSAASAELREWFLTTIAAARLRQ